MIGVVADCRLGNQLFQYAFIKGLSARLNTPFFINQQITRFIAADYFDFDGYRPKLNRIRQLSLKLSTGKVHHPLQCKDIDSYDSAVLRQLQDKTIYRGYFQSVNYFNNIKDQLPQFIRVKKKFSEEFERLYGNIFSQQKIIAVHIRRGDYLNLNDWWRDNLGSNNLTLPADYYRVCLQQIPNLQNYRIIFLSDDMDFVKKTFADIPNALFSTNSAVIDFQLLLNAQICIIANSSFAWWAAYLNTKPQKRVFCPQYWLGFKVGHEYPRGIIPSQWTQIPVPNLLPNTNFKWD